MKVLTKRFGIIAFLAIISLSLSACELLSGGIIEVYNGSSSSITVTIRQGGSALTPPSKYQNLSIDAYTYRAFVIDSDGTYTVRTSGIPARTATVYVLNGTISRVNFPSDFFP